MHAKKKGKRHVCRRIIRIYAKMPCSIQKKETMTPKCLTQMHKKTNICHHEPANAINETMVLSYDVSPVQMMRYRWREKRACTMLG